MAEISLFSNETLPHIENSIFLVMSHYIIYTENDIRTPKKRKSFLVIKVELGAVSANGGYVDILLLLPLCEWRHATGRSFFSRTCVRLLPIYEFSPHHPTCVVTLLLLWPISHNKRRAIQLRRRKRRASLASRIPWEGGGASLPTGIPWHWHLWY